MDKLVHKQIIHNNNISLWKVMFIFKTFSKQSMSFSYTNFKINIYCKKIMQPQNQHCRIQIDHIC